MNKPLLIFFLISELFSQQTDSLALSQKIKLQAIEDTSSNKELLPEIRKIKEEADKLELGEPFFELKSSIDLLNKQMDSLKQVISIYEQEKVQCLH